MALFEEGCPIRLSRATNPTLSSGEKFFVGIEGYILPKEYIPFTHSRLHLDSIYYLRSCQNFGFLSAMASAHAGYITQFTGL